MGQGEEGERAGGRPCARCPAALGGSCCEVQADERLATLTDADVERVCEATGLAPARFLDEEWLTVEEARAYEERRPLFRGYFADGPRRLTLRRSAGACVFHSPGAGCRLPEPSRPTACRLYPFELWPDGTWSLHVTRHGSVASAARAKGESCLAVEEASSMDELLSSFGLTREAVEDLGARQALEVAAHARERKRRARPKHRRGRSR